MIRNIVISLGQTHNVIREDSVRYIHQSKRDGTIARVTKLTCSLPGPDLKLKLVADKNHRIARDYGVLLEEEGVAL